MFKKAILFLIISTNANAYSNEDIAQNIKRQALVSNIDQKILYTIAKIESGFNPFIIAFTSNDKNFDALYNVNLKIANYGRYGKKYLISATGKKSDLIRTVQILMGKGYFVDVGLMQVNSQNFSEDEVYRMFDLDYNLWKAVEILKNCKQKLQIVSKTIECYNKGFNASYDRKLEYYKIFLKNYLSDFGG